MIRKLLLSSLFCTSLLIAAQAEFIDEGEGTAVENHIEHSLVAQYEQRNNSTQLNSEARTIIWDTEASFNKEYSELNYSLNEQGKIQVSQDALYKIDFDVPSTNFRIPVCQIHVNGQNIGNSSKFSYSLANRKFFYGASGSTFVELKANDSYEIVCSSFSGTSNTEITQVHPRTSISLIKPKQ